MESGRLEKGGREGGRSSDDTLIPHLNKEIKSIVLYLVLLPLAGAVMTDQP